MLLTKAKRKGEKAHTHTQTKEAKSFIEEIA